MQIPGMENEWWRGGIIYQIYPRSFADSNNDGIGDLPGITAKLDYIASLGVDAIWISPFFTSPMKDFGYDVSDYYSVDPMFGTIADFKALTEKAHALGIKVMIDQVISHSSDQHVWFTESRANKTNPKADWYVWADAKPDGTPPNNWLSIFGGSAWEWDTRRQQYYMHNFLKSQPDLNFHNPEVRQALLDILEFWLKLGVDGFRLDTANYYFHDQQLRDNPANSEKLSDVPESNPYSKQQHIYDKTRPENVAFLEDLRKVLDKYPGSTTVGEIGAHNALEIMPVYTEHNKRLHMVYSFEFLNNQYGAGYFRQVITQLESKIHNGWPCWAFGNHDVPRAVSRWGAHLTPAQQERFATFLPGLLLSFRGSYCLYQGEELGLLEAEIPFEKLQDPYGITFWPEFKGRDGCRTPIPWESGKPNAGFSSAEPWLPVPADHQSRAANTQNGKPSSTLEHYRNILHWRKSQPALRFGEIAFVDAPEPLLVFDRTYQGTTIRVVANMSETAQTLSIAGWPAMQPLEGHGYDASLNGTTLSLPGHSLWFGTVG